jgi:glycosyltransferase involved in cell wall biosynthesis
MIIYTFPVKTAFIQRDLEMISPSLAIKPLEFTQIPYQLPFYFLLQFFQLLWYLPKTTQYLCFFGGYHSVLPVWFGRCFRKKCIIQAGGTDCINMPEIGYGNFRKKWLRIATIYSFRNCQLILPVTAALVKQDYHYDGQISPKQGILNLIPDLKTPIQIIPNGFDTDFWKDLGKDRKPFSFVTVATGTSHPARAKVKGYDLIDQLAENNPTWNFTLIGDSTYVSKNQNIKIFGKMNPGELLEQYNTHQFYLQLSSSEGFPNALGEAMACGCIGLGSAVGAIPDIIGPTGLILLKKNVQLVEEYLNHLKLDQIQKLSQEASQRISENFNYSKRKSELLGVLTSG